MGLRSDLDELREAVRLYKSGQEGTAIEIIKYNHSLQPEDRLDWCERGIVAIEEFIKHWQEILDNDD